MVIKDFVRSFEPEPQFAFGHGGDQSDDVGGRIGVARMERL